MCTNRVELHFQISVLTASVLMHILLQPDVLTLDILSTYHQQGGQQILWTSQKYKISCSKKNSVERFKKNFQILKIIWAQTRLYLYSCHLCYKQWYYNMFPEALESKFYCWADLDSLRIYSLCWFTSLLLLRVLELFVHSTCRLAPTEFSLPVQCFSEHQIGGTCVINTLCRAAVNTTFILVVTVCYLILNLPSGI